ncbi:MAG TPA: cytochrome c, partial [Polyangiaceae bacterium]|nr:cytochrome c [Polyangiaceae bacterium]
MKLALLALLALAGCAEPAAERAAVAGSEPQPPRSPPAPDLPGPQPESGPELIARFQCARCHEMNEATASAQDDCVGCHRAIVQGTFDAPRSALRRWRHTVEPLDRTPSLRNAGARLRREWIEQYLLHPFDVRPHLRLLMPRLDLTPAQAATIAQTLAPFNAPPPGGPDGPDEDLVERGRSVYRASGCWRCHAFGGSGEEADPAAAGIRAARLAPDLRFVRARFVRARLEAWLRDPRDVDPDATMPGFDLSDDDLSALSAFLLAAPLTPPTPRTVPERLPVLSRPVRWPEVERRVFRRIC